MSENEEQKAKAEANASPEANTKPNPEANPKTDKDSQYNEKLTPEQYHVAREKGTERAFTGKYWDCHEKGIYRCVCCNAELFSSEHKFESGSGWPSFYLPLKEEHIAEHRDMTQGMLRTEVTCKECGAHLGHVFPDGPKPSNLRYCINSASLELEPKD